MGQRDAGLSGTCQGRGDAGHDLEGDPGVGERFRLLPPAAEHEGIAALQPHHFAAFACQADQQVVDALLRQAMVGACLADIDPFGVAPG